MMRTGVIVLVMSVAACASRGQSASGGSSGGTSGGGSSGASSSGGPGDASSSGGSGDASSSGSGSLTFDKTTLDAAFRAEGVGVFDVDRDGHLDIVTDQYWYSGPAFTPHEIRAPQTFDPATQYSVCYAVFPRDVNGDGWTDAIVLPRNSDPTQDAGVEPVYWYENPRGAAIHWTPHLLAPATAVETGIYVDLFRDGQHELVMGQAPQNALYWMTPAADPTQLWTLQAISPNAFAGGGVFQHGLGTGDVDGDGRADVLTSYGWFQGTADPHAWPWHAVPFGPDACSRMYTYDVDGDGRADVFCARPHDYGFHWLQQQPPAPGEAGADPTFVDHLIDDTISEMHALVMDDLDGDGVPELVSGKRFWAHGPSGSPGAADPALLVYYKMRRDPSAGPMFDRVVVDSDSGVGTQFEVIDVDGDGKKDIVVSNKKGLFYFRQR